MKLSLLRGSVTKAQPTNSIDFKSRLTRGVPHPIRHFTCRTAEGGARHVHI